jgi:hypothetical protein
MATNEDYKGNKELKKHGVAHEYTKEEIEEYIKCSKDIVHFAQNYIKVVHPDRGLINIDLYPFQTGMLEHFNKNRFSAVLSSRQSGKSVLGSINIRVRRRNSFASESTDNIYSEPITISIGDFFYMLRNLKDNNSL